MARVYNFYAGPATLPLPVLEQIQKEFVDYRGTGLSLVETSHRSPEYDAVHNRAVGLVRELLQVPEGYSILLLGGGATMQFGMVPMNLTGGAAREFAPHGIRVNAIAPGFFLGHQNRRLLVADDTSGELTPRGRAIVERTPFGRFGTPQDLEGATLFLASARASGFVTGVTLPVDGGFLVDTI